VAYADSNNVWRLAFNLVGTFDSASKTTLDVAITGVVFKNTAGSYQSCSAFFLGSGVGTTSYVTPNAATITSAMASAATVTGIAVSGDVELNAEPAWAAANMEGVIAADVYIVPASGATPGIVDGNAATWNGPKTFSDAPIFNSGIYLDNVGGVQTLLNYFEFGTFNLNGDFASDVTVRYTRIDRIVIMTSEGVPGHSTPINTASTAASCVPAQLRPIGDPVTNIYLIGDGSVARMVQVSTAGVVTTNYYDVNPATGLFRLFSTGKSDTGTRFSITYELGAPA
jgi:hypothetical protein